MRLRPRPESLRPAMRVFLGGAAAMALAWAVGITVVFATLCMFSLLGLIVNLIADLTYMWIDPRIDFETREV